MHYSDLKRDVVRKLSGRPETVLRYQVPSVKNAIGYAHKGPDGKPVIDIHPLKVYRGELSVLLHESAHVRLHSHRWKAGMWFDAPAETKDLDHTTPRIIKTESEADNLAAYWLDYAEKNYKSIPHYYSDMERKLKALLAMPERMINP